MKKYFLVALWLLVAYFLVLPRIVTVEAAHLELDPATVTAAKGETFNVDIIVDAGSDEIVSTDAFVLFDAAVLQVDSVADGDFFPTVTYTTEASKLYVAGLVDNQTTPKTGKGKLATVTFKVIGDKGADVTFDCRTDAADSSKIIKNDINSTNVIVCADNTALKLTLSGTDNNGDGTSPSPSVQPTAPTTLPKSGGFDNLFKIGFFGSIMFIIGGALMVFI